MNVTHAREKRVEKKNKNYTNNKREFHSHGGCRRMKNGQKQCVIFVGSFAPVVGRSRHDHDYIALETHKFSLNYWICLTDAYTIHHIITIWKVYLSFGSERERERKSNWLDIDFYESSTGISHLSCFCSLSLSLTLWVCCNRCSIHHRTHVIASFIIINNRSILVRVSSLSLIVSGQRRGKYCVQFVCRMCLCSHDLVSWELYRFFSRLLSYRLSNTHTHTYTAM